MTLNLADACKQLPDFERFYQVVQQLSLPGGFFEPGIDLYLNRTPGRLDLMGGNDDYTGGLVFESTILEATFVAIQPRRDSRVIFFNPAVKTLDWEYRIEFDLSDLMEAGKVKDLESVRTWIQSDPKKSWCAYILGDLYFLIKEFGTRIDHGFSLYLESNVPLGKGVSSSAALEVAPMKAMASMYGIEVGGVTLAGWTQWVEIALTQSACGIMDQLAVVMGDRDHFVPMLCQPCEPYPLVKLPRNLRLWGVDSGVRHAVSGIEYEAARAATFMGYRYLCDWEGLTPVLDEGEAVVRWVEPKWNGYLANVTPALFRSKFEERLPIRESGADFNRKHPQHLDPYTPVRNEVIYPVKAATRYAVEENWRVKTFYNLILGRDPLPENIGQQLGELMYQAHAGYSDCGLGSEATDLLVELVRAEEGSGLLGAKVTGGGAGGTVAILGWDTPSSSVAFEKVVRAYEKETGIDPYVFEGSSPGCDAFGVVKAKPGL
jgi:galactokinase